MRTVKRTLRLTLALLIALASLHGLGGSSASAQDVPARTHFQGRLTDASNNPLTGPNGFVFGIYDAPAGGSLLWTETQPAVPVVNGVFAVELGAATPLPSTVFSGSTAYLQVTVNGNVMTPRERLVSVPFAHNSELLSGRAFAAFVSTDAATQSIAGAKTFTGTVSVPAPSAPGHAATKAYVDAAGGPVLLTSTNTWSGQNSFLNLVSVSSDLVITGVLNRGTALSLGGPLSVAAGVTAASGTFTASGPAQFSLQTSSGVSVGGTGGVYANFFSGSFYGSGAGLTGLSGTDATKVAKDGDAMTGQLTLSGSTLTVTGDAFSVGGSTFVVKAGRLGIGTTAPASGFHMVGDSAQFDSAAGFQLELNDSTSGGGNQNLAFRRAGATVSTIFNTPANELTLQTLGQPLRFKTGASAERMRVAPTGELAIGLTVPAARLHVSSGTGETGDILIVSTGASNLFRVTGEGKVYGNYFYGDGSNLTGINATDAAKVAKAGDAMTGPLTMSGGSTITVSGNAFSVGGSTLAVASGNVGIGTSSPTSKLQIEDSALSQIQLHHTGGPTLTVNTNQGNGRAGMNSDLDLDIQPAGNLWLARQSGRVGIATVNPTTLLDVNGNAQFGTGAAKSTFTTMGALTLADNAALTLSGANGSITTGSSMTASAFFGSGAGLTGVSGSDSSKVAKAGDAMTGPLTVSGSSITIVDTNVGGAGDAFSLAVTTAPDRSVYHLVVSTTGNVGIGTANPGQRLEVKGSAPADGVLRVATDAASTNAGSQVLQLGTYVSGAYTPTAIIGDTSGADSALKIFALQGNMHLGSNTGGAATTRMVVNTSGGVTVGGSDLASTGSRLYIEGPSAVVVDNSGSVGVGTTNPVTTLDVNGGAMIRSSMTLTGVAAPAASAAGQGALYFDSAQNKFLVSENGGAYQPLGNAGTYVARTGDAMTGPLTMLSGSTITISGNAFSVGGSTFVVTSGKVGIGAASPDKTLNVFGTANNFVAEVWNQGAVTSSNGLYVHSTNADPATMVLAAGNLSVMGDGKVGVGTTAPTSKLEVAGDIRTSSGGDLILNPAVSGPTMYLYNDFGELDVTSGTPSQMLFTVKSGGNVGIGTDAPTGALHVKQENANVVISSMTAGSGPNSAQVPVMTFTGATGLGPTSWDGSTRFTYNAEGFAISHNAGGNGPNLGPPGFGLGTGGRTGDLFISSIGAVGVGTTNPVTTLDVNGGAMIRSSMTLTGVAAPAASAAGQGALYFDSAQNKFLVSENGGAYQPLGNAGTYVARTGDAMTGPLTMLSGSTITISGNAFSVGGTTLVVTGGNIGVGTANPGARLEVNGAIKMADVSLRVDTGDNDRLVFQPATPNTSANIGVTRNGASGSSGLEVIGTDYIADRINYEMFRILANEGVVPPRYQLISAAGGTGVQRDIAVGFGASESVRFAANGNVGIGTTTPTERLQFDDVASGSDIRIARKASAAHAAGNVPSSLRLSIFDGGEGGVFVMNQRNLADTFNDQYIRFDTHEGGSSAGERVRIAPNGNVGVGTTSPGAKLDVAGHQLFSVAGASITFNAGGPTIGVPTGNTLAFGTSGIERMRIDNVGNLGVATDAPGHQLQFGTHFNGTVANAKMFINSGGYNAWNGKIAVSPDGNAAVASVISSYHDNTLNIQKLGLGTIGYSGVERTMVLQNGNVGILTETPANPLQVSLPAGTGTPYVAVNQTADNPYLELQRWTGSGSNYEGVRIKDVVGSGGILAFETVQNGGAPIGSQTFTERMRIQGGNVGIGTSTPGSRLEAAVDDAVNDSTVTVLSITHATTGSPAPGIGARLNFKAERSDGNLSTPAFIAGLFTDVTAGSEDGDLVFGTIRNSAGSGDERMRITSDGSVGIGTTSPGAKLHVAGDIIGKAQVLRARMSANFSKGANSWEKIPFDQTLFNTLSGTFDTVNNRFTASRAGYYQVSVSGYSSTASTAHDRYALGIRKNGVLDYFCGGNYSDVDTPLSGCPGIVYLNGSTDYVEAFGYSVIAATWNGTGTTGHEMFWFISYAGE